MTNTFSRFDVADYLTSEDDILAYLDAAAEEGDVVAIATAFGTVARARGMSQIAREVGMTREGLYKALSPDGNPSFAMIAKVSRALGYGLSFRPVEKNAAE